MHVSDAIRTLVAVRGYQDRPIPEEAVRRILEAGRLSPSAANKQPWHFIAVQEPATIRQLAALAPSGPYVAGAPLAIVVVVNRTPYAVSDASRAIQNMLLAAWEEGIGGNWVGFGGLEGVNALLGIPSDREVLAILPFGYPAEPVGKGQKRRKPLAEVAFREKWGEAFG